MTMPSPGIATENSFESQPAPFCGAMFPDCLNRVSGTGWCISAGCHGKRGNDILVYPDQADNKIAKCYPDYSNHQL